jgi:hypothetical protein
VQPRDKPHPDQVEIAIYNRGVDEPETTTSDPITALQLVIAHSHVPSKKKNLKP